VVRIQLKFLLHKEKKNRVHDTEPPIAPVCRTNRRYYANNMKLKNKKCDEMQNGYYYGR